jgi:hypothetical protein
MRKIVGIFGAVVVLVGAYLFWSTRLPPVNAKGSLNAAVIKLRLAERFDAAAGDFAKSGYAKEAELARDNAKMLREQFVATDVVTGGAAAPGAWTARPVEKCAHPKGCLYFATLSSTFAAPRVFWVASKEMPLFVFSSVLDPWSPTTLGVVSMALSLARQSVDGGKWTASGGSPDQDLARADQRAFLNAASQGIYLETLGGIAEYVRKKQVAHYVSPRGIVWTPVIEQMMPQWGNARVANQASRDAAYEAYIYDLNWLLDDSAQQRSTLHARLKVDVVDLVEIQKHVNAAAAMH